MQAYNYGIIEPVIIASLSAAYKSVRFYPIVQNFRSKLLATELCQKRTAKGEDELRSRIQRFIWQTGFLHFLVPIYMFPS
jgi:hypothetical protein